MTRRSLPHVIKHDTKLCRNLGWSKINRWWPGDVIDLWWDWLAVMRMRKSGNNRLEKRSFKCSHIHLVIWGASTLTQQRTPESLNEAGDPWFRLLRIFTAETVRQIVTHLWELHRMLNLYLMDKQVWGQTEDTGVCVWQREGGSTEPEPEPKLTCWRGLYSSICKHRGVWSNTDRCSHGVCDVIVTFKSNDQSRCLRGDFRSNHWSQGLLPPAGRTERTQERHSCKINTIFSLRAFVSSQGYRTSNTLNIVSTSRELKIFSLSRRWRNKKDQDKLPFTGLELKHTLTHPHSHNEHSDHTESWKTDDYND